MRVRHLTYGVVRWCRGRTSLNHDGEMDTTGAAGAGTPMLTREQTDTKAKWRIAAEGSILENIVLL
jgi:hypothetical protein